MKKSATVHAGSAISITNIDSKYHIDMLTGKGIPKHLIDSAWSVQLNSNVLCIPNKKPESVNYNEPQFVYETVYISKSKCGKNRVENYLKSIIKDRGQVLSGLFFSTIYHPRTVNRSETGNDEHFESVDEGYIIYLQNKVDAMAIKLQFEDIDDFDEIWKMHVQSEEF